MLLAHLAESFAGVSEADITELRAALAGSGDAEEREMTTIWHDLGKAEGLELGLEQGLEQGRADGVRRSVRRLLEAQFGPLPAHVEAALGQVSDEEHLEQLIVPASRATSLEEFLQHLPRI